MNGCASLGKQVFFQDDRDNAMERKHGFTLVELLVVISIIALLMAVILPALNKAREQAKRVVCSSDLKQIGIAMIAYTAETDLMPFNGGRDPTYSGTYRGPSSDSGETHPYVAYRHTFRWPDGTLIPMRLACLYARGYVADPKTFYCPSNMLQSYMYRSYTSPDKWGTLPQTYNQQTGNEWVRAGYTYYPIDDTLGGASGTSTINDIVVPRYTARRFSQLSRNKPYVTDGLWSKENISHKSGAEKKADGEVMVKNGGINALFKDGHVRFVRDEKVSYMIGLVSYNGTIFDNEYWNTWAAIQEGEIDDPQANSRVITYGIYSLIKP
jgi:prepilin-type N-terminal cleavage/methylation domain-containing protein